MIQMPRVLQTPSSAYSPTVIAHDIVFLHVMEGGCAGSVKQCQLNAAVAGRMLTELRQ